MGGGYDMKVFKCSRDDFIRFLGAAVSEGLVVTDANGKVFQISGGTIGLDGKLTITHGKRASVKVLWETHETNATFFLGLIYAAPLIWWGRNKRLAIAVESIFSRCGIVASLPPDACSGHA